MHALNITSKCIVGLGLSLAMLVPLGSAQAKKATFSVVYTFQGGDNDGAFPLAGLIADKAGNLYGTTADGGNECRGVTNCGTVFKLAPNGTETVLYAFCAQTDCADGSYPYAGLSMDKEGNLYGTTTAGGNGYDDYSAGYGVVFKLAPDDTESVLYAFCAQTNCTDGATPQGGSLILDRKGNLYGTTYAGGYANCCGGNLGTVFKVSPSGSESVLFDFCQQSQQQGECPDGYSPFAGLIADSVGNFYGATRSGGTVGAGTIYELSPNGTETVLYSFCPGGLPCIDGQYPTTGLLRDSSGNLYGTTGGGGSTACSCGVVYKLTPNGTETVLYSFTGGSDGGNPEAGLVEDRSGNLYGTTLQGGSINYGVVFKIAPNGSETVLHTFCSQANCTDGGAPYGSLLFHKGYLYGTTEVGGLPGCYQYQNGCGVVFKIKE